MRTAAMKLVRHVLHQTTCRKRSAVSCEIHSAPSLTTATVRQNATRAPWAIFYICRLSETLPARMSG
jgi:hypothetical protein